MRAPLWLVAVFVAACATPQPDKIAIVGRYALHLTQTDIRDIHRVASSNGRFPLRRIDAIAPDRVRVETRSPSSFARFSLMKRNGKWLVDIAAGGEAEVERTIITNSRVKDLTNR